MAKEFTKEHLEEIKPLYLAAKLSAERLLRKMNQYGGSFANYRDAMFFCTNCFYDYDAKTLVGDQEQKKEDIGIERLL